MDLSITHALNQLLLHHDSLEDPISFYESASLVLFAGALVALLALPATRTAAIVAAIATPVALAVTALISALFPRARPFVSHHNIHAFVTHTPDPGFPSDHATASFAIAVALLLRIPRVGVPLLIAAVVLAVGRVAIGVHWPTDVLAGAIVGTAAAFAASRVAVSVPALQR